jgi:pilus assembly protein CpaB
MGSKFGKSYPVLTSKSEKDRVLFVAAALLALSLAVVFIMLVNPNAGAKEPVTPDVSTSARTDVGTVVLYAPERRVSAGSKLASVVFRELYWPRSQIPEGAVRDVSEISNLYAAADLTPGVPVQRSQLTTEPKTFSIPVTKGNRAVTIEVDGQSGIEGWATPGTYVDVVLTSIEDGKPNAAVIVQNARILSLGGDLNAKQNPAMHGVMMKSTLTLDVQVPDALKIETSKQLGKLSLMMRAPDDQDPVKVNEMPADKVRTGEKGKEKARPDKCNRGKMRMGDREWLIGCDGGMTLVENDSEP